MDKKTLSIHTGRYPHENDGAVNPPIVQSSTILFKTLKDYIDAESGIPQYEYTKRQRSRDYGYGIAGTTTTFSLRETMATLENADHCLVFPSGLNAITSTLTAFLKAGDHILVTDSIYGPTRRFCNKELKRFGIETTYYDPLIGNDITSLIKDNTKIVFCESPGSITFELQDIPAITQAVKSVNDDIVTIIDNSWATPLYFSPFEHGIDVSIHAGTKYIGGHSDLLLGLVNFNEKYAKKMFDMFHNLGISTSPNDCYLAQRGIRTMPTRLKQHEETALEIAISLEKNPRIAKVLHPALPSFPQHELWKRDFQGSTGLFSVILKKHYTIDEIAKMTDNMNLFGIGCSWGGYESLLLPLDPRGGRTATKWEAEGTLLRIYIGLEAPEDLLTDLEDGLERLGS